MFFKVEPHLVECLRPLILPLPHTAWANLFIKELQAFLQLIEMLKVQLANGFSNFKINFKNSNNF